MLYDGFISAELRAKDLHQQRLWEAETFRLLRLVRAASAAQRERARRTPATRPVVSRPAPGL